MDPAASPSTPPPPPPETAVAPERRPRRRWWRIAGVLAFALALLVVVAPYALSLGFVRRGIENDLSEQLGTRCSLERLGFNWFSGFALEGLRIGNPPGFDQDQPMLQVRRLAGDLSLGQLLRGRIGVVGLMDGLEVRLDQDQQGVSNVERVLHKRSGGAVVVQRPGGGPPSRPDAEARFDLAGLRLDLKLSDALIEIRRQGQLLEALRSLSCEIKKEFGTQVVKVELDTRLSPTAGSTQEGRLLLHADVDAATNVAEAMISTAGLDLARWQPLAALFLEPGALTAMGGVTNGTLTVRMVGADDLTLGGDLTINQPHFAGALLRGMDVRSDKWTLSPNLAVQLGETGGVPSIRSDAFAVDLGFLRLSGMDATATGELLQGRSGLGCRYELDVDTLATFGGPMPDLLRNSGGRVTGKLALPLQGGPLPDASALTKQLVIAADVQLQRFALAGFELATLDATLDMRDGRVAAASGPRTRLNSGSLSLGFRSDVTNLDAIPLEIGFDWKDGKVGGEASQVLRYVVPLLAGLDERTADLAAGIDLSFSLRGPALKGEQQSWLQFLDQWSGGGRVSLRDGSVTPAPALRGLLQPLGSLLGAEHALGDGGRLSLDQVGGDFTLRQGTIEATKMRWLAKGREFGLAGKVRLDGGLDFGIDVSALLAAHRDGQRLLQLLGNQKLVAGLGGSVVSPSLGLPDPGKLLRGALQEPGALQREGGRLLQKTLDDLLGGRKKV